jgi:hypothetical protein
MLFVILILFCLDLLMEGVEENRWLLQLRVIGYNFVNSSIMISNTVVQRCTMDNLIQALLLSDI